MQWLASLSVRRPVLSTVLILLIVVVGVASYLGLGVDKFPKIEFPIVTITTVYPGSSPEAVETDVTDKIESVVNTLGGVESLTSISNEGVSLVVVQFAMDKDIDSVAQDVRSKLDMISRELPADIEQPQVQKVDPDATPILLFSVSGNRPVVELTRVAEDVVKRRLETINGVGEVQILGGQKRRINVVLDPVRMRAVGVTALEIQRAVATSNADVPGGRLKSGPQNRTLRFAARTNDPQRLADIVIRQSGQHPIFLRDVATVEDSVEDAESGAYRDGKSTIVLALRKQSGGNTVEVVDAARAAAAEIGPTLPSGVTLDIVRDNSESIRVSIHTVLEHLILGGLFAALVVLLFLGDLRSTIISAISIPVSLIGTFALMELAGFTLDLMTLLALALSVGIVIDDSIIVLENIHRFIDEKGMKPFPAAIEATKEIGPAVLATSLSLMAVFLPVSFMSGIVGKFLLSFGLTMTFAVLVSVIVAFTVVPMLSARVLPPRPEGGHETGFMKKIVDFVYRPIEIVYMAMLRFSMRFRFVIVLVTLGSLITIPMLAQKAGFGFLPLNDDAQFEIYVETKTGTSLDQTAVVAERAAREVRGMDHVLYTLTTIGDGNQQQTNVARVYVRLSDPDQRIGTSQQNLIDSGRELLAGKFPEDVSVAVLQVADISAGAKSQQVQYVISGPELSQLEASAKVIAAELAKVPGAVDVSTSLTAPSPEVRLVPDLTRAAALGVSPTDIAMTLRLFVEGAETSKYQEGNLQYEIYVRGAEEYRRDSSALGVLMVPSATLGQVPLTDVVTSSDGFGPSAINRLSRQRQVTIGCNIDQGADQGSIVTALEKIIKDQNLPSAYSAVPFGQSKEMAKMGAAFGIAFMLSFLFMYLVLAAQFESWLHPLTILLSLPMTLPFAFLSLVIFGQQLNMFSILGLLVLFGVVKKNAILQIDQANLLRREHGMARLPAILEANRSRLKPILMTTIAFVAGMLPLVFATGIGSGMSKAMATIVVGGQSLSLLLTLLAIPVYYSIFDDMSLFAGKVVKYINRGKVVDRGRDQIFEAVVVQEYKAPVGSKEVHTAS